MCIYVHASIRRPCGLTRTQALFHFHPVGSGNNGPGQFSHLCASFEHLRFIWNSFLALVLESDVFRPVGCRTAVRRALQHRQCAVPIGFHRSYRVPNSRLLGSVELTPFTMITRCVGDGGRLLSGELAMQTSDICDVVLLP